MNQILQYYCMSEYTNLYCMKFSLEGNWWICGERKRERRERTEREGGGEISICYQEKSYRCVTGKLDGRCDGEVMQKLVTQGNYQTL